MNESANAESGAGETKRFHPALWLFGGLVLFAFAGGILLLMDGGQSKHAPQTVTLPDGSKLTLAKVRYGSSYKYEDEGFWKEALARFAPSLYRRFYRGSRRHNLSHSGGIPQLGLYLVLEDPTHRFRTFSGNINQMLSAPPHWTQRTHNYSWTEETPGRRIYHVVSPVPRSRREMELSITSPDPTHTTHTLIATFSFVNPGYQPATGTPSPPTPMPLVVSDGTLSATLYHVVTSCAEFDYAPGQLSYSRRYADWKRRALGRQYYLPPPGTESRLVFGYTVESLVNAHESWALDGFRATSRYGDLIISRGSHSRTLDGLTFNSLTPSLVPEAAPYDVSLTFVKTDGFTPDEVFSVDTELQTTGSAPVAGASTVRGGVRLHFGGLAGPDYQSTATTYSSIVKSSQFPVALLDIEFPSGSGGFNSPSGVDALGVRYETRSSSSSSEFRSGRHLHHYSWEIRPVWQGREPTSVTSPPGTSITLTFAFPNKHTLDVNLTPSVPTE